MFKILIKETLFDTLHLRRKLLRSSKFFSGINPNNMKTYDDATYPVWRCVIIITTWYSPNLPCGVEYVCIVIILSESADHSYESRQVRIVGTSLLATVGSQKTSFVGWLFIDAAKKSAKCRWQVRSYEGNFVPRHDTGLIPMRQLGTTAPYLDGPHTTPQPPLHPEKAEQSHYRGSAQPNSKLATSGHPALTRAPQRAGFDETSPHISAPGNISCDHKGAFNYYVSAFEGVGGQGLCWQCWRWEV